MLTTNRSPANGVLVINPGDSARSGTGLPDMMLGHVSAPEVPLSASSLPRTASDAAREVLRTALPQPGRSNLCQLGRVAGVVTGGIECVAGGTIAFCGLIESSSAVSLGSSSAKTYLGVGSLLIVSGAVTIGASFVVGRPGAGAEPRSGAAPASAAGIPEIEVVVIPESPRSEEPVMPPAAPAAASGSTGSATR